MATRRRRFGNHVSRFRGSFNRPLSLLIPSAVGAAGALAVNAVVNYAPLPDALKAGNTVYLTRAGLALAIGMVGPRLPVLGRYASDMARGALIVTMTDFGKVLALQQNINLSGLGYIGPARVVQGPSHWLRGPRGMSGAGVGRAGMYINVRR
jgi:hypothetical protein